MGGAAVAFARLARLGCARECLVVVSCAACMALVGRVTRIASGGTCHTRACDKVVARAALLAASVVLGPAASCALPVAFLTRTAGTVLEVSLFAFGALAACIAVATLALGRGCGALAFAYACPLSPTHGARRICGALLAVAAPVTLGTAQLTAFRA